MSAVLESVATPITEAQAALEVARRDLVLLEGRIRACEEEIDQREIAQVAHRSAVIAAVTSGERVPKPPKVKASDAEVAVPILKAKRKELNERVAEREGQLRRAMVAELERRYAAAQDAYAHASATLIDAWRGLVGVKALLDQAGMSALVAPLPSSLTTTFAIPALGRMRAISEHHWAYFVAEHALAQGELARATDVARVALERDIGMKLPW